MIPPIFRLGVIDWTLRTLSMLLVVFCPNTWKCVISSKMCPLARSGPGNQKVGLENLEVLNLKLPSCVRCFKPTSYLFQPAMVRD